MKLKLTILFSLFVGFVFAQGQNYEADGDYFLLKGEYDKAIDFYDKAIYHNDTNAYNYFLRGLCKYKTGNFAGSIPDFTKSIGLCPKDI